MASGAGELELDLEGDGAAGGASTCFLQAIAAMEIHSKRSALRIGNRNPTAPPRQAEWLRQRSRRFGARRGPGVIAPLTP